MTGRQAPATEVDPRRFLDLSGSLQLVAGFDAEIRWLSASFPRLLGTPVERLLGKPFTDFLHPEDLPSALDHISHLVQGEERVAAEFRVRSADGSYRRLLCTAVGVPEEVLIYVAATDVTGLREAEVMFGAAFSNAPLATILARADPARLGRLTAVNPAVCELTGRGEKDLLAGDLQSLLHPDDLEAMLSELEKVLRGDIDRLELEARLVHADGTDRWIRKHASLIRGAGGEPALLIGQMQDITDHRRAREEVVAAGRRFAQLFDDAPIGMALQDPDGRYVQVNRALCELFGRPPEEMLGLRFQELVHPDDMARDEEIRHRMLREEISVAHREKRFRHSDGSWLEADVAISCVAAAGGLKRFIVQVRDVTDRNRAEHAVRRSHERLQSIIDGMPSSVFVKDLEGRFEMVNRALADSRGLETAAMVGRLDRELFPAEMVEQWHLDERRALQSLEPTTAEHLGPGGETPRTYLTHLFALRDEAGEPFALAGTATDITERVRADEDRRQLELRAQETQRLETVGKLAGGVAHDFNNLLSVILNGAALAAETLPEGSQARSDLDEIRSAAERAADLTHQLVQFSRQEMVEPRVLDPNTVVARAQRLLERTIGEDIELRTRIGDDVPNVEIDPVQLERILVNLAVNARDAMPGGGTLEIATAAVEVEGASFVRLTVSDDGHGMSPEAVNRAFEPFFTTKPRGEGAGLGLATVYGIVKQSHGVVDIDSVVGEGTRVVMRLPAAGEAPPEPRPPVRQRQRGRGERVLVVEDEDSVRRLAGRLLRDGGYEVLEASGGGEALEALGGNPLDLLLTDVVMPGKSGRELARELTVAQPGLSVLFMSGYTDDVTVRHGVAREGLSFLAKPFTRDSLLLAVSSALARRRG